MAFSVTIDYEGLAIILKYKGQPIFITSFNEESSKELRKKPRLLHSLMVMQARAIYESITKGQIPEFLLDKAIDIEKNPKAHLDSIWWETDIIVQNKAPLYVPN